MLYSSFYSEILHALETFDEFEQKKFCARIHTVQVLVVRVAEPPYGL